MNTYTIKIANKNASVSTGIEINGKKLLLGGQMLDVNLDRAMIENGRLIALYVDDKKYVGSSLINIIPPEDGMMEIHKIEGGEVIAFRNTPTGRESGVVLKKGGNFKIKVTATDGSVRILSILNEGKNGLTIL